MKNLYDDVHNLGANAGTSHENTLNDSGGESLNLCVTVLDQFKSRFAKLVKLRRYQVQEDIY